MASVYQTKLNYLLQDGARSTKFGITGITDPFGLNKDIYTIVKTAQFPGKFHDVIDFKYKGRNIPIKGQTRYDNTWTCTFYLEETHKLRDYFSMWIESLDQQHNMHKDLPDEVIAAQEKNSRDYTTTITIAQYNFDDDTQETATYQLYNAFPKSVNAIDVDYSAVGNVLEYTVEFAYSHFHMNQHDPETGNAIDKLKNKFLKGVQGIVGAVKGNITNALTGVIKSAQSGFSTNYNAKDGSLIGGIGGGISSGFSSLVSGAGSIFSGVDFNPMHFINK